MKSKILILLFITITSIINAQLPENAEDISPLLIGETLPEAKLIGHDGQEVSLNTITKEKPTLLVFYRGGWCPYCNRQLAALADTESQIIELGYQIVAISPDNYKSLTPTLDDNEVKYHLYSDPNGQFIQDIGIGFKSSDKVKQYIAKKTNMDAADVLPVPTVMVVNTDGLILYEYINPNYKTRLSEAMLLSVLEVLKSEM
jgi:peroxiredoxin